MAGLQTKRTFATAAIADAAFSRERRIIFVASQRRSPKQAFQSTNLAGAKIKRSPQRVRTVEMYLGYRFPT